PNPHVPSLVQTRGALYKPKMRARRFSAPASGRLLRPGRAHGVDELVHGDGEGLETVLRAEEAKAPAGHLWAHLLAERHRVDEVSHRLPPQGDSLVEVLVP